MSTRPGASLWFLAAGLTVVAPVVEAQPTPQDAVYRVFLAAGEPLPSYGEPAIVGDRVIFNLLVGEAGDPSALQLVSLPAHTVDTSRTSRYSDAMRASYYRRTRGEAEYAAITAEVARALDQLSSVSDRRRRLTLAEEARRRLLAWSDDHFQYRREDIQELSGLFDDVINELRIAVGEPAFSFDLVSGSVPVESLLPPPTLNEAVALALAASKAADVSEERIGILKKASGAASHVDPVLEKSLEAELDREIRAAAAYAALQSTLRARVTAASRRADAATIEQALQELDRRDRQLGGRRPAEIRMLREQFTAALVAAVEYQDALAEYTRQRAALQQYQRLVQPLLVRFSEVVHVLEVLRDRRGVTTRQLSTMEAELGSLGGAMALVRPPPALTGVHATLESAFQMGRQASLRRREARSSQSAEMREASSAAAGALLLSMQAGRDLAASLQRPSIR